MQEYVKYIENQIIQMINEHQLDLFKAETKTEEPIQKSKLKIGLQQPISYHIISSNEELKTFNMAYGKDLMRLITIIKDQRTNFEKSLKEIRADLASVKNKRIQLIRNT